ncbi:MAG: hypothetical protein CMO30_22660 [Tistrella sp.]|uniref:Uncharacterized protein n=1 Tax=Tistrella mobilis TaxID=171437 RepID=A0A3B9IMV3_9PROT|nr:hypothetical protein [Tistrella sp.]MBA78084.1 hypothetical protein [Tistrella sp.]HAE49204.1 hypothetical protein [Tistrella mobilis]
MPGRTADDAVTSMPARQVTQIPPCLLIHVLSAIAGLCTDIYTVIPAKAGIQVSRHVTGVETAGPGPR